MIRFKVLVHEAKKTGYDKPPLPNPKIETHYDAAGREVLKITPPTGMAQFPGQIPIPPPADNSCKFFCCLQRLVSGISWST